MNNDNIHYLARLAERIKEVIHDEEFGSYASCADLTSKDVHDAAALGAKLAIFSFTKEEIPGVFKGLELPKSTLHDARKKVKDWAMDEGLLKAKPEAQVVTKGLRGKPGRSRPDTKASPIFDDKQARDEEVGVPIRKPLRSGMGKTRRVSTKPDGAPHKPLAKKDQADLLYDVDEKLLPTTKPKSKPKAKPRIKKPPRSATTEVTFDNLQSFVQENEVVVLSCSTNHCHPCKMFEPTFKVAAMSRKNKGVAFGKVKLDDEPMLHSVLDVRAAPSLVFIRNGIILYKHAGPMREVQLTSTIQHLKQLDIDKVNAVKTDHPVVNYLSISHKIYSDHLRRTL